jgi:hypothetical protein
MSAIFSLLPPSHCLHPTWTVNIRTAQILTPPLLHGRYFNELPGTGIRSWQEKVCNHCGAVIP